MQLPSTRLTAPLDRLAIADPRPAHVDLQAEVAVDPVLEDLQVQLAHARDQGLAGLLVDPEGEGRVFARQRSQGLGQLPLVGRADRLDRHADDRLGELDPLEQDRVGAVAERVAGDRVFEADDAGDVAGDRLLDLLAVVGPDVVEPRADLLLVLARVVDAAARLEPARVDPHEREVAVGVVGDLEHQPAKRLVGAGLAGDLGPFLGMVADDGGLVERAGQVGGDRVQQPLDADVAEARAAQDRVDQAGQGRPPQRGDDLAGGQLGPFEVGHVGLGERLVVVGQGVEHLLAPELGLGTKVLGDLGLGDGRAQVLGLVEKGLHRDQVDQALELPHRPFGTGADRDLHGDRVALQQPLLDFLKDPVKLGADAVQLVDEADPRDAVLGRLPPDGFALRLDPFDGREHDDRAVEDPQRSLDLGGEVDVAGRVDDVDRDRLARRRPSSGK